MRALAKNELTAVGAGSCATDVATAIGGVAATAAACASASVAACLGAAIGTAAATQAANESCTAAANGVNTGPAAVDALGNQTGAVSDSGGGGGGGKVICTELCRNGIIEHDVWMADIRYSRENFSEQTMRGYHLWGIPYVKLMRKSPLFAKIAAYPTSWFAEDIAYRMGVRAKPNLKGWVLREILFRPICSVIGVFAKARDWQALWRNDGVQALRS